jgi:hypothetical protein
MFRKSQRPYQSSHTRCDTFNGGFPPNVEGGLAPSLRRRAILSIALFLTNLPRAACRGAADANVVDTIDTTARTAISR